MKHLPRTFFSVLIPDGESIFALKVLNCLGPKKGVTVYVLSNDESSPIRFSRYTKKILTYVEKTDSDRLQAIMNALAQTKADVILPVDVKTIRLISAHKEKIEKFAAIAPLAEIDSIDMADDKWLTYNCMFEKDIPCPPTLLYAKNDHFKRHLETLSFPVLSKPRTGSGGVGIHKFSNRESLLDFYSGNTAEGEVIVQSFISGFDIDCSILCKEGEILAYTIQKRFVYTQRPVAGELGVDFVYHEPTWTIVKEFAKKQNWTGIAHIDLRFDESDQKIKIIEINPRFWASVSQSLFAGVNFPYIACLHALNHSIPEPQFLPKRIIQLRSAVKIILKKIIARNRKDLYFDHIFLNHISPKDPLPYFVSKFPRLSSKLKKKSTDL